MIPDQDKTKEQLIAELNELRRMINPVPQDETACDSGETLQTRQILRENKELLSVIADYTSDWETLVGLDGKLLWVNPAVEKITGYSREEYFTMPDRLQQIIFNDDQDRIFSHFENGLKYRKYANDVEFRIRCKDGSLKWVSVSYQPVYMADGECLGLRSSIRDISERKVIETALRESEAQYRDLVENVNSAVLRFNARGRITFCNKFTERLFGYSREELIAQSAGGTISPAIDSSGRNLATLLGDVIANPELYSRNENENICKDGRRLWMSWCNTAIRDEDGNVCEFIAVGNDITPQRQITIALQESEEKYRTLLNDATDAILLADAEGNIFEVNKQSQVLLGYTAQELTGMNFADLHPEQERDMIIERVKTSLLPQQRWSLNDVQLQKKDGTTFPADISGHFIAYAGKSVIQGVIRDISERKAVAEELETYRRHLEDLVKTRTAELTTLNLQLQQEIQERNKTEESLRRSEEQFRSVIETASDAIITANSSGNIILWNKGAEAMFGYPAEEILNRPFTSLIPASFVKTHQQKFNTFIAEARPGILVSWG
jgi:PAS domain S-box-containing protein